MPGGKVEAGEPVRAAAARELEEETGLVVNPSSLICVAVTDGLGVDSDPDVLKIGLCYARVVDEGLVLRPEPEQPARWWALDDEWPSIYPHDRKRLLDYVATAR